MQKVLIIANPVAGRGQGRRVAQQACTVIEQCGWTAALHFTAAPLPNTVDSARRLVQQFGGAADRVVVIGGDGTLREVLAGLLELQRFPGIALVPLGNANVIAREFGIPLDAGLALKMIASDTQCRVDIGEANGRVFLAILGMGFDANVVHFVSWARATRFGAWLYRIGIGADFLYGLATVLALCSRYPRRYRLRAAPSSGSGNDSDSKSGDGPQSFATVWVANVRCYAKGWSLTPNTNSGDGLLSVRAEGTLGPLRILKIFLGAMRRLEPRGASTTLSESAALSIRARQPFKWQLDGDAMPPVSTLEVTIHPGALNLIVPTGNASE